MDRLALGRQHRAPALRRGEVGSRRFGSTARLDDRLNGGGIAHPIDIDAAHVSALARQRERDCPADVGGRASDERALALEEADGWHHALLPRQLAYRPSSLQSCLLGEVTTAPSARNGARRPLCV